MNRIENKISDIKNSTVQVFNQLGVPYGVILKILAALFAFFVIWLFFIKEKEIHVKISDMNGDLSSVEFYSDEGCTRKVSSSLIDGDKKNKIYNIYLRNFMVNNAIYAKQKGYICTRIESGLNILALSCKEGVEYDACDEKWSDN